MAEESDSLSGGEIAGIVIGCVVFVVIAGVLIYFCTCNVWSYRRKKKLRKVQSKDEEAAR